MSALNLCIVSATTNAPRALSCIESWFKMAANPTSLRLILIGNGPDAHTEAVQHLDNGLFAGTSSTEYLGTVAAFKRGVDIGLELPKDHVLACIHDDLEIHHQDWDQKVLKHFERHPSCGLLGFGGAIGLGADGLYDKPYDPMSLARIGFRSNLVDAENHGIRSLLPERVACLDGFSQIGRREFWDGHSRAFADVAAQLPDVKATATPERRPWQILSGLSVTHHAYDGILGVIAAKHGWDTWFLPVRCTHFGGRTAVGDQGYQHWAQTQQDGGDGGFWREAHRAFYEYGRDLLPLRV